MNTKPNSLKQSLYNSDAALIFSDGYQSVCCAENSSGSCILTAYQVFPGIDLINHDVHSGNCHGNNSHKLLEIAHCREGRIEHTAGHEFYYLTKGDLSIRLIDKGDYNAHYPLHHYHGISILIDAEHAPECFSCVLEDVNVNPRALIDKFCPNGQIFIMRADTSIEHIFSELYSVPKSIKKGYYKVKILELMLFLSSLDIRHACIEPCKLSLKQVSLIRDISEYLAQHMDSRVTIEQLSKLFHVSQTQLKQSFKGVYGISVYAYIRSQKMQAAAIMLRQSDMSVLEIAGHFGYDNGSKFAKAFKEIIGLSPTKYRALDAESAALPKQ